MFLNYISLDAFIKIFNPTLLLIQKSKIIYCVNPPKKNDLTVLKVISEKVYLNMRNLNKLERLHVNYLLDENGKLKETLNYFTTLQQHFFHFSTYYLFQKGYF